MAKKRSRKKAPTQANEPPRSEDSKEKIDESIKKLRKHYRLGQMSLRKHPERMPRNSAGDPRAKNRLWKARRFAHIFSPEEFEELIRLSRQHKTALRLSSIELFVTVDATQRKSFTEQAIREGWSNQKITIELRKRFARRRKHAGRKPRPPQDPPEALSQLLAMCVKLTRWGEHMGWQSSGDWSVNETDKVIRQLPGVVSRELEETLRAAARLQNAAEKHLPQSSNGKKKRRRQKK